MVFTYIGMETKEVPFQGTPLRVVLKDDTKVLDEVVVVGYGSQKKVNLTGSVATVNFSDETLSRPVTTVSEAVSK